MKKKILLFITLFSALFISATVFAAEIEILNTDFSTYEALVQSSGSTPLVSADGNYQIVRGTITPTGGTCTFAPNTSFFLTTASAGLITFNNLDLFQGGRIVIEWGSVSGRPLKVCFGTTLAGDTIETKPTLVDGDRSKVMTAEFPISADTTGVKSITIGSSGGGAVYIFSVKVYTNTSGPQAPKVETLSIAGTAGTILLDTIRVNLPYASYTVGVTSVATSGIVVDCDSATFDQHVMDIDSVSVLTDFIVGDTIKLVITNSDTLLTNVYTIITTADVPVPTITNPANKTQAVKGGLAIAAIKFAVENQTNVSVAGLPAGLSGVLVADTFTISGTTPTEASYPVNYNYTVTVTGIAGADPLTVIQTGTITIKDPNAKAVLYLTIETGAAQATNLFLAQLQTNYDVTIALPGASVKPASEYSAYDLIVLNESIDSGDADPTKEIGGLLTIDKPILNTKSYFYKTTSWNLGTPSNGNGETALEVEAGAESHPIFSGITMTDSLITIFSSTDTKTIQSVKLNASTGGAVLATISGEQNVAIHEMDASERGIVSGTSKYLMIALFNGMFDAFTADGLTLLDNACEYLLGATTTDVESQRANILTMTIGGATATINENTITVQLPYGSSVNALAVVATVSRSASVTSPASLAAVDFTSPVTFTVTAENVAITKDYTVTVTVAAPSSNATLTGLTLSLGTLSPVFASGTTTYNVVLPYGTTSYPTITPTAAANAVVSPIGYAPATVPGVATILVTAQDGVTTKTYTINFTVASSINEATTSSKVYASGSSVVVDGKIGANVAVVSLVGNILYKGVITTLTETLPISLEKGVYVVLLDDTSTKIIIK